MPSPRGTIEFLVDLGGSAAEPSDHLYLAFQLGTGAGPFQFAIFPSTLKGDPAPFDLGTALSKLGNALNIDALSGVAKLSNDGIWKEVFDVQILPELLVTPSGSDPSIQAVLKVFYNGTYGLTIGVKPINIGPVEIQIEPQITIYEFGIQYTKAAGLKLDAVVDYGEVGDKNPTTNKAIALTGNGRPGAGGAPPWTNPKDTLQPPKSAQKVGYPFPMPATKDPSSFRVNYFGIGQRFGIDVDLNDPNPISAALTTLEKQLTSTTPTDILPKLATYYHPDRDWFLGIDISLKGWELKVLFNDPALYGIEVSSTIGAFAGFDFEILYQKLGPKNGVYYGAITLPTKYRTIELGAASLTLPNFKLWIYTDGDFRFAVGWPLWDQIFTVEVDIFTGGGGLYFGKLRSGDLPKPQSTDGTLPAITYDPILEFGLGLELGLGRSFTAGPLQASLFVGLRGVFQGLLAWQVTDGKPGSLSSAPDYHWFSASVSLVGMVNGSVDLAIVSLSFSVNITITATIAFETDCKSILDVDAYVEVSATLKILFIHIHISFHTTVHVEFTIGSGAGTADPAGPTNPFFKNAIPSGSTASIAAPQAMAMRAMAPAALAAPGAALSSGPAADGDATQGTPMAMFAMAEEVPAAPVAMAAAAPPVPVPPNFDLHFLLYPAVDYTQPADSQLQAVCGLIMESDQFLSFLMSLASWLTATYTPHPPRSNEISVTTATFITSPGNLLSTGDTIVIAGSTSTESIGGTQVVTVNSPNEFTVAVDLTIKDTTGTWTKPDGIITAISPGGPALITSTNHGLSNGDTIVIAGSDSTPVLDGQQIVTVQSADTFTVAVDVTIAGTTGTWIKPDGVIAGISVANPTVIASTAHGLSTGDTIVIAGSNSTPVINGSQTVTVLTPDTFSVAVGVTQAGAMGTWTKPVWAITGISANSPTIVTSTAHGLMTGDTINITGSNSIPSIDGKQIVTAVTPDSFAVAVDVRTAGTTGTWGKLYGVITNISVNPTVDTVTSTAHGLMTGDTINITGANSTATFEGQKTVTVPPDTSPDMFTVEVALNGAWTVSTWDTIATRLGTGSAPAPTDFRTAITNFLATVSFTINGIDLTAPPSGTITGISAADPTVVTSVAHGLSTGNTIVIAGSDSTPAIDGPQIVTVQSLDTFTIPVDVTSAGTTGTWTKPLHTYLFAMPPVLELSSPGQLAQPRDFATYNKTPPGYSTVLHSYLTELSLLAGRIIGDSGDDNDHSMADVVFYDYLLLLCRQLAHEMVHEMVTEKLTSPTADVAAQVGGVASRYLLHGLRLPQPNATIPSPGQPWDDAGLYTLTGQQFTLPKPDGTGKQVISATLAISPSGGPLAPAFHFAPDPTTASAAQPPQSATSHLPLPASVPPAPSPGWNQDHGEITLEPRPGIVTADLWFGVHNRVQWTHTATDKSTQTQGLVQMPPRISSLADAKTVTLKIYPKPSPYGAITEISVASPTVITSANHGLSTEDTIVIVGSDSTPTIDGHRIVTVLTPDTFTIPVAVTRAGTTGTYPAAAYDFSYALRIPLDISTVARRRDVHATWSDSDSKFSPTDTEIPGIYRIQGVDDADRDRLAAIITALGEPNPPTVTLHVLLPSSDQLVFTSSDGDEANCRFLKTSLATTSSPGVHTAAIETLAARAMAVATGYHPLAEIGPVAADITNVSGVLQLLYEASIVHAGGFFLSWPGSDGKGLPDSVFKDGAAELELLILMPGATSVQEDIQNVLVTASETAATVYLQVMDGDGTALPDPHPSMEQGSIGFDMSFNIPDPSPTAPPFDPAIIQSLYHLMQFRIDGTAAGSAYSTSVWSSAIGPMSQGQGTAPTYIASLPIWKFVTGADPSVADPTQALAGIGKEATLDFRLADVFGNALPQDSAYSMAFSRLYDDPLVLPSTWPGAHLGYTVTGDGQRYPELTIALSFEPNPKWKGNPIASISIANLTVITSEAHGLKTGDTIVVSGSNSTPTIDGTWVVTALSSDTFAITVTDDGAITNAGTTGTWTKLSKLSRITGITSADPTVITSAKHGLSNGDQIDIAGSDSIPTIDGQRTVNVVNDDTFTVPVAVTTAGTVGIWTTTKPPNITAISAGMSVITSAAHGLETGDTIIVAGSDSTPPIDGPQVVTVKSPDTFTVAVAVTQAGTTGSWTKPSEITGISAANPTVVTSISHGLKTRDTIMVAGGDSTPPIDGPQVVTVKSPDTFTVAVAVTQAGKKGIWTKLPDLSHLIQRYQQIVAQVSDQNLEVWLLTDLTIEPSITDITAANPTVITTTTAHGLATGDTILIEESDSTPAIDGQWIVTVLTPDTFSIPVVVTKSGTKGIWSNKPTEGARTTLVSFATAALAYMQNLAAGQTPQAVKPVAIVAPLARSDVASLPLNIFRVTVDMTLSRPTDLVDPDALAKLPEVGSVTQNVPPLIDAGAIDNSPLSLKAFGQAFETAYAGFDGPPASKLKLTVRAEKSNQPNQAGPSELWAVRMSSTSGIALSVPDVNAVAFTMEPASTTLVSGTVDVTTYDDKLTPTTASHTFNGIALDDWMSAFLFAMDSLLSPTSAPVIAGLPPNPSKSGQITGISVASPTAITSTAHGLSNGDIIVIADSNSTPVIDGLWIVTVTSPDTFTVVASVTAPGTKGNWSLAAPFARLMAAKEGLAKNLAARVVPVFQPETGQSTSWQGDLASAQDMFEQTLLQDLSQAYTISVIMQAQLQVSEKGTADEHAKVPPRFYGALPPHVATITAISVSDGSQAAAVITSAKHGLSDGDTIIIAGSDSTPPIDGPRVVTVKSPDTFTIPVAVTRAGTTGTWTKPSKAVTISNATLALPEAAGSLTQALTWTISVKHPETDAFLHLNRDYNIGFMEHYIDLDANGNPVVDPDEAYGYVPSSWLRFVVTEDQARRGQPDPLLNYALPAVSAPIPLHEFPPTPTIASQNAKGDPQAAGPGAPIKKIIEDALEWDYTLTVAERELDDEQDDLWLMISYNLSGSGGITHSEVRGDVTPDPLLAALAQFTTSYRSLSALLPQLQVGATPIADLPNLAEILAGLAENVSHALASKTSEQEVAGDTADPSGPSDAPDSFTDIYVVEFLKAFETPPILTVYAKIKSESDTVIWPTIDGQSGTEVTPPVIDYGLMEGLWKQAKYNYSTPGNGKLPQMKITWADLKILERQTVRPQIKVVRNADLAKKAPGMITNPALVYSTPLVTASRLVPYVDVAQTIDVLFAMDLPTTLTQILTPFFEADATVGTVRKFKVKVGYEYALGTDPNGNPLVASNAILLVDGLELGGTSPVTVHQFAIDVAAQIEAWMNAVGTNNKVQRWITLAISLFANLNQTELPLISLARMRIQLP